MGVEHSKRTNKAPERCTANDSGHHLPRHSGLLCACKSVSGAAQGAKNITIREYSLNTFWILFVEFDWLHNHLVFYFRHPKNIADMYTTMEVGYILLQNLSFCGKLIHRLKSTLFQASSAILEYFSPFHFWKIAGHLGKLRNNDLQYPPWWSSTVLPAILARLASFTPFLKIIRNCNSFLCLCLPLSFGTDATRHIKSRALGPVLKKVKIDSWFGEGNAKNLFIQNFVSFWH